MVYFQTSITINRPVDIVIQALMNPDNFPFWQTDLDRFEVINRKPGDVGSVGILHYSRKGNLYKMEDKLIYCEPGRKYISQITGNALTARVETILHTDDNKTEMVLKWSGKGEILLLKILLPFMKQKMIRRSTEELERFKLLVETKGSNFSVQAESDA